MKDELTRSFRLAEVDSLLFARLSGDFNPLHIDPVFARRTLFGAPVAHGIHLLLKALDEATEAGLLRPDRLRALSVTFNNPARSGATIDLRLQRGDQAGRMRMVASAAGSPAFSAQIDESERGASGAIGSDYPPFAPTEPKVIDFPLGVAEGDVGSAALAANSELLRAAFAHLGAAQGGSRLVIELCATTRIVGMQCPGLHSIFAGLKLQRRSQEASPGGSMTFRIYKVDPRFRRMRLWVEGAAFEGMIETFFRPPPVRQRALEEIIAADPHSRFAGQRALVVGGSRGLGELAAKILLAGQAEVTITYSQGGREVQQLCREAQLLGRQCRSLALDVAKPLDEATSTALGDGGFTHLYYFASPRIIRGPAAGWDQSLFEHFALYYLRGMAEVSWRIAGSSTKGRRGPHLFVPSTVFIDTCDQAFAEYCAAKAAAETLCGHLAHQYGSRFAAPRLPRVRTDQTVGLTDSGGEDPFPVLQQALAAFCVHAR